jgi:hypothetical protein
VCLPGKPEAGFHFVPIGSLHSIAGPHLPFAYPPQKHDIQVKYFRQKSKKKTNLAALPVSLPADKMQGRAGCPASKDS